MTGRAPLMVAEGLIARVSHGGALDGLAADVRIDRRCAARMLCPA